MATHMDQVKEAWRAAPALLDVFASEVEELVAFVQTSSKDDLTVFTTIHGIEAELPLFKAILDHPALDRATALTIFHACNPAFYEKELLSGTSYDTLAVDQEDAIFLEILEMAYKRLTTGPAMTGKFQARCLDEWARFPHVSPVFFKRWRLTESDIAPTEGLRPMPSVRYDHSKIRLSFTTWKYRN